MSSDSIVFLVGGPVKIYNPLLIGHRILVPSFYASYSLSKSRDDLEISANGPYNHLDFTSFAFLVPGFESVVNINILID